MAAEYREHGRDSTTLHTRDTRYFRCRFNMLKINDLNGGGGGSRTPVRRGPRLEDYMLSQFAYRFCWRFSGTGKYGPPASLSPLSRLSLKIPRRLIPSQPADRRLSPPCGPDEGDGYLIRQRRHTACWQLSMSHADYGWCGPPACLLSVSAPVETGTPPRLI